jgi:class 3 adenylate cyclase
MPESSHSSPPFFPSAWLELPDGRHFWLKGRCAIGRMEDNDLVLKTTALSRHHALLATGPGGYVLTDLHSSNGTYVNRALAKRPVLLHDRDEIQIGDIVLRYRCTQSAATTPEAEFGLQTTQMLHQVHTRLCWLLVADIVGYSTLTQQQGGEVTLGWLRTWIADVGPLLEHNGGRIQDYIGDAIFAYWPCESTAPGQVGQALAALEAYRARSPVPFRLVVHHGSVLFTKAEQGERLSGQEVNFVFRAEKVAKQFRTLGLFSQPAVQTLQLGDRCPILGESAVDGLSGTYQFFGPPSNL